MVLEDRLQNIDSGLRTHGIAGQKQILIHSGFEVMNEYLAILITPEKQNILTNNCHLECMVTNGDNVLLP